MKSLDSNSTEKGMLYFYDIQLNSSSNSSGSNQDNRINSSSKRNKNNINEIQREAISPFLGIALYAGCSAVCVKWQPKSNQILCR